MIGQSVNDLFHYQVPTWASEKNRLVPKDDDIPLDSLEMTNPVGDLAPSF